MVKAYSPSVSAKMRDQRTLKSAGFMPGAGAVPFQRKFRPPSPRTADDGKFNVSLLKYCPTQLVKMLGMGASSGYCAISKAESVRTLPRLSRNAPSVSGSGMRWRLPATTRNNISFSSGFTINGPRQIKRMASAKIWRGTSSPVLLPKYTLPVLPLLKGKVPNVIQPATASCCERRCRLMPSAWFTR